MIATFSGDAPSRSRMNASDGFESCCKTSAAAGHRATGLTRVHLLLIRYQSVVSSDPAVSRSLVLVYPVAAASPLSVRASNGLEATAHRCDAERVRRDVLGREGLERDQACRACDCGHDPVASPVCSFDTRGIVPNKPRCAFSSSPTEQNTSDSHVTSRAGARSYPATYCCRLTDIRLMLSISAGRTHVSFGHLSGF